MLDIHFIREHPDIIRENNARRGCTVDVDEILKRDQTHRTLITKIDELRAARNKAAEAGKPSEEEIKQLRAHGDELKRLEEQQNENQEKLNELLSWLPNLFAPEVPHGKNDTDNVEIKRGGTIPAFDFTPKDHQTLGEELDIIDVARAVKVAGTRFYYLKNDGVLLRLALIQYGLKVLMEKGFSPFFTPHLARTRTLFGTGYLPFFKDDIWRVGGEKSDLSLIGTSEQTLVGYHQDEILDAAVLPLKYAGLSSCFRTEAGSYGKDTKGILRVHEFYKLEQIIFCLPEESEKWHEFALAIEERFCQELGLPYRVVLVCDGDCGAPGYKKYDIEVWFPAQDTYREATSNTNLTDFQTRRLNTRVKYQGKAVYPHTISATGLTDRFLIAILENNQRADGSVAIPEPLQPYLQGREEIRKRT
ncbi:serine--tRNA ligase [Candidatus Uhrbacteria bacterium RIFCSPHIGHO2_12_FULL_54_23]|uniref:Serine--tRNA ligase n=3 Tax=Candidatus Uhriibacteriota TaxID=1752732 RepID=A0A1F7UJP1_9BACT|nr:MAG: serine--tRNA ligase [Candidatus Uhrbacteria bacterium RIFCSPHIGHO2_12_FULL_54_23]OGL83679.1 MAG: serine--tRNA ligase [Candidatus Uhrbacteria bacterium RIFCSPLOWO2_01_FULL_55_36]OGL90273.1 MAG: serine--tRNA ligase [Candidatus Uhrbacteria bacterium RIFCSPLOWO2_02_FULL_54_37]